MSILKAIASISSVIDKLLPTRKQRQIKEYETLTKNLEKALQSNSTGDISAIRERLRQLRNEISSSDLS